MASQTAQASKPKISVIVTTYNRAMYLEECLQSVLKQDFQDFELVIVDDGSMDNTDEVVRPFLLDPRVKFVTKTNGGQASALNTGLAFSSADLVAFLDSDCRWLPSRLREHYRLISEKPRVGVLFSENSFIDHRGHSIPGATIQRFSGQVTLNLLDDNFVPFNSVTVRRWLIEKVGGFNEGLARNPDYEFWLEASLLAEFHYLPEVLTEYRISGAQLSNDKAARFRSNEEILRAFSARHAGSESVPPIRDIMARFLYRKATYYARLGHSVEALRNLSRACVSSPLRRQHLMVLARIIKYCCRRRKK